MAETFFRRLIEVEGLNPQDWRIESAGTWASEGLPVIEEVQKVLLQRGLDASHHRSRSVSQMMVASNHLILVMEPDHKEALQVEFPLYASKVQLLSEMIGETFEIADPVGGQSSDYEKAADEIYRILQGGFSKILSLGFNPER